MTSRRTAYQQKTSQTIPVIALIRRDASASDAGT